MVNEMSAKQKQQLDADKKTIVGVETKGNSIYDKYKKDFFLRRREGGNFLASHCFGERGRPNHSKERISFPAV